MKFFVNLFALLVFCAIVGAQPTTTLSKLQITPEATIGSNDYDGKWNGTISCSAYSSNPTALGSFTRDNDYYVATGRISAKYLTTGGKNTLTSEGNIANGIATVTINGTNGKDNWIYQFNGKPTSAGRIVFTGNMVERGVKERDCTMVFTSTAPSVGSLLFKEANAVVSTNDTKSTSANSSSSEVSAGTQSKNIPNNLEIVMNTRKALVIGNDSYKSVAKLINAREDAKTIASNLTAVGYQVTLKIDLNEKDMKSAIRAFSSQVQGGDEVLFFFAGHGVQLGATNYLLPTDIGGESEAQVKDEAIQLQRILDDMSDRKAKFTLAMIDACRDNPFKTAGRAIGGRGLAPTTAATGQMVVFSAGTGQQALDRLGNNDKNKNGVFTRTFVKEMQKPGLSIDRIVKNVRNEVAELAKTVGHEQVPAIYDQVLGDFYFKK